MRPLFPEHRVESVFYRALRKLGQRNQFRGQLSLFTLFSHPSPRSAGLHVHQWPSWPQSLVSQTWFCLTGVSGKAVSWFIIYIFLLASACSIKFLPQYVSVFDKCHASSKEPNGTQVACDENVSQESGRKKQIHCCNNCQGIMTRKDLNGSRRKKSLFPGQQICSVCIVGLISLSLLTHSLDQWFLNFSGNKNHVRKLCYYSVTSESWDKDLTG